MLAAAPAVATFSSPDRPMFTGPLHAYDNVNWSFLRRTLRLEQKNGASGLGIESFVSKGSVGIKVNDDVGRFSQNKGRFETRRLTISINL